MTSNPAGEVLKLTALDEQDLEVLSAHLQDAVLRIADITYDRARNQFAVVVNRFDWVSATSPNAKNFVRRRTGLHFNRVHSVRSRVIRRDQPEVVHDLLSIEHRADDPPAGRIVLTFAGGGEIELFVECIEASMMDLGPAWATSSRPRHED